MVDSTSAMLFLPAFIVATQMYNSWSLRTVLLICSFVILIGAWMRVMLAFTGNFWWLIAGQTVIGISNPITTGGVSIIANYWFADNERARATSLMMVSNPIGILLSFGTQAYISSKVTRINATEPAFANENWIYYSNKMLFWETIVTSICCIYFWIVFRKSRPDLPPSLAATRRKTSITQGMWNDVKILAGNKSFVLLLICFMLIYSVFGTFGFVLSPLVGAYGY